MIISTLEELRLYSPSNAIDSFESLAGFISSSEHDVLEDKLGTPLFNVVSEYYKENIQDELASFVGHIVNNTPMPPLSLLLSLSQRIVIYDALSRAVDVQTISVNGAGVNVVSSNDYKAADSAAIASYKKACVKETHTAINRLLVQLEEWAKLVNTLSGGLSDEENSIAQIVGYWTKSQYFYLATQLVIPSAVVLQEYYNIYDSRERFITLLPDLRYIQEDVVAPIFGEEFIDYLVKREVTEEGSPYFSRIMHDLRKIVARQLESRLLKPTDYRQQAAYNEALKLTERLIAYLQGHQPDFAGGLAEAFESSPLYVKEKAVCVESKFKNNAPDSVMFVTPGLF